MLLRLSAQKFKISVEQSSFDRLTRLHLCSSVCGAILLRCHEGCSPRSLLVFSHLQPSVDSQLELEPVQQVVVFAGPACSLASTAACKCAIYGVLREQSSATGTASLGRKRNLP